MASTTTGMEQVLVERHGTTTRITLNRPARYNALSLELMEALRGALERVAADPETRAIVIAGAGRGFSAGHDLSELVGREEAFHRAVRGLHAPHGDAACRAAARDRARARGRDRGRLPARGGLRSRRRRGGRALRDAGRADRPLLHDADGAAVPRDRPQARAADAAHRGPDRRADGPRLGTDQRRRPRGGARRRGGRPGGAHRGRERARRGAGEERVLRPGRPAGGGRVRGCLARHGPQRRRCGRPGGHGRVPREAPSGLAGLMLPPSPRGAALSPVAFLDRAAAVFPHRTGVVDGERRWTWAQLAQRARRLAVALQAAGIGRGDRVAIVAPSSAELLEAHFGVPAAGAVLVAVDGRLAEQEVAELLERSLVRLLVVDAALEPLGAAAASRAGVARVLVCGPGGHSYEAFLAGAGAAAPAPRPVDEEALLSVTYASAAGDPADLVATTHRAAHLDAPAQGHHAQLDTRSVYLWTVPLLP